MNWIGDILELAWKLATIAAATFAGRALYVNLDDRRARSRPILFIEEGAVHCDTAKRVSSMHVFNVGAGPAVNVRIAYESISAQYALRERVTHEDHPDYGPFPELTIRPIVLDVVGVNIDPAGSLFSPDFGEQIWRALERHFGELDDAAYREGRSASFVGDLLGEHDDDIVDTWFYFKMECSVKLEYHDAAEAAEYARRGYIDLEGKVRHRTFPGNPINYSLEQSTSTFDGTLVVLGNLK